MKVMMVVIDVIHSQAAYMIVDIERSEEVFYAKESCIERASQYPAEFIVSDVEVVIVCIHSISVSSCHSIEIWVDAYQEIVVDFIEIVVLPLAQVEFVSHAVSQEACISADVAQA